MRGRQFTSGMSRAGPTAPARVRSSCRRGDRIRAPHASAPVGSRCRRDTSRTPAAQFHAGSSRCARSPPATSEHEAGPCGAVHTGTLQRDSRRGTLMSRHSSGEAKWELRRSWWADATHCPRPAVTTDVFFDQFEWPNVTPRRRGTSTRQRPSRPSIASSEDWRVIVPPDGEADASRFPEPSLARSTRSPRLDAPAFHPMRSCQTHAPHASRQPLPFPLFSTSRPRRAGTRLLVGHARTASLLTRAAAGTHSSLISSHQCLVIGAVARDPVPARSL